MIAKNGKLAYEKKGVIIFDQLHFSLQFSLVTSNAQALSK